MEVLRHRCGAVVVVVITFTFTITFAVFIALIFVVALASAFFAAFALCFIIHGDGWVHDGLGTLAFVESRLLCERTAHLNSWRT